MAIVWPSKNNFANGDVLTAANMNNIADTLNVFNPTSATNGQVWIANGSASGAFGTLSTTTFQTIATSTSTAATVTLNVTGNNYRMLSLYCLISTSSAQVPNVNMNGTTTAAWYKYSGTDSGNLYNDGNGTPFRFGGTGGTTWSAIFNFYRTGPSPSRWTVQYMASNGTQVANLAGVIFTGTAMTSLTVNTANVTTAEYQLMGILN